MIGIGLLVAALLVTLGLIVLAQRRSNPTPSRIPRTGSSSAQLVLQAGDDLQRAINDARLGDTITLPAGATFTGPIVLPDKGAGTGTDDFITIRSANLSSIPPEGERIKPGSNLPRIVAPSRSAALSTKEKAHHYKFIGVEFAPAQNSEYVFNLIDLGASDYASTSQLPHHLVFDRCYVHSTGLNKARRGFAVNSGETSIINSYISGFAGAGDETQAIAGWNGTGPFHIVNNYLEGGGEVLLFGGADPSIQGLVPSDIEIRRNFLHKPAEWAGRATIKGTLELKNAKRVVIDGNIIDTGIRVTAFVITVRNQNGRAPWSTIEDVQIVNNIVRHASTGVNILGSDNEHPSQEAKRISIVNNLFLDLVSPGDVAYFLQTNGAESVAVSNNTVQQAGNIVSSYGSPTRNFSFINNIVQHNSYGITCFIQEGSCLESAFCRCFPKAMIKGNIIADNLNVSANSPIQNNFPTGNFFVASYEKIGFINYAAGNLQLMSNSGMRKKGTDGKDPGVDFDLLNSSGVNSAADGRTPK